MSIAASPCAAHFSRAFVGCVRVLGHSSSLRSREASAPRGAKSLGGKPRFTSLEGPFEARLCLPATAFDLMALTSDEVNLLVYRYLQESGASFCSCRVIPRCYVGFLVRANIGYCVGDHVVACAARCVGWGTACGPCLLNSVCGGCELQALCMPRSRLRTKALSQSRPSPEQARECLPVH